MYASDVFLFFKNYFWHQHIKTIQNIQTILNFSKKKIKIFWKHGLHHVPNMFEIFIDILTTSLITNRFLAFACLNFSCRSDT